MFETTISRYAETSIDTCNHRMRDFLKTDDDRVGIFFMGLRIEPLRWDS